MSRRKSPIVESGAGRQWQRFELDCAMLTAPGVGRPRNEDQCVFAAPGDERAEAAGVGYLLAVIDGVSEGGMGGAAARETATSLLETLDDPRREALRPDLLMHRIQDANDRCEQFIGGRCAATAVWIWEEPQEDVLVAAWAHVGDARLCLHNSHGWKQLTRDHAKGPLLDRAVGQGAGLMVDTGRSTLRDGEHLVLMTDGVWKTAQLGDVFRGDPLPDAAESVRLLVGQARLNGSRDDTSAIAIAVHRTDL